MADVDKILSEAKDDTHRVLVDFDASFPCAYLFSAFIGL